MLEITAKSKQCSKNEWPVRQKPQKSSTDYSRNRQYGDI